MSHDGPNILSDVPDDREYETSVKLPATTCALPFSEWLRTQHNNGRKDGIGAFARAAMQDPDWPGGDVVKLREYFRIAGARPFVIQVLDDAWREFLRDSNVSNRVAKRRKTNKVAKAARARNRRKR